MQAVTKAVIVRCCSVLLCGAAVAAPSSGDESGSKAPPVVGDEIIVLGKNWGEIRAQIQRAEQAVYDRFNDINSNDEFDIHCYRETLPESRMVHRACESNATRNALAKIGEGTLRAMQGTPSVPAAVFVAEMQYKNKLLANEMKELGAQDAELKQALWRLGNLEHSSRNLQQSSRRPATASVQQTADQGTLPYGAALAADVRIARKPWTHTLTHRTFAFAHVYGAIQSVEVRCKEQTEQLVYEAGGEWTLPEDRRACDLRVQAPRGTAFTLYEFE